MRHNEQAEEIEVSSRACAATFVDDVRALAATLQTAVDERRQAKSRGVSATKSIVDQLKTGRQVMQALDIVLTRALERSRGSSRSGRTPTA